MGLQHHLPASFLLALRDKAQKLRAGLCQSGLHPLAAPWLLFILPAASMAERGGICVDKCAYGQIPKVVVCVTKGRLDGEA